MKSRQSAILYAILAAVCYGISAPVSKLLLDTIPPVWMAALLYLGAGLGMLIVSIVAKGKAARQEARMTKKELPYILGMIALDILAPICLMLGLRLTSPATASLMNNFEIVATALIALFIFKEAVGKRMWLAIFLITLASILLSVEDFSTLTFSAGSLLILLACICWGFENNCTRMLSLKNPLQIVIIKGFGSGLGSLLIACVISERAPQPLFIALALLLGFVAYGLSIFFYIHAQRQLGATRTSAYYAFAPLIGAGLSFAVFGQRVTVSFAAAFVLMMIGAYFAAFERHSHEHTHEALKHEHRHQHGDGHHNHAHDEPLPGEHSHIHTHENTTHAHPHTPDSHHWHGH